MHDQLQHHIHLGHPLSRPPQQVTGGAPELARSTDYSELRRVVQDLDAAGHGEGAAVVGPIGEHDGDGGHEHLLVL